MPEDRFPKTAAGWPYIEPSNWLYKTPEWSLELAAKLDAGDADVAAAINAAREAQEAAALLQGMRIASGRVDISLPAGTVNRFQQINFPGGRFTSPPTVLANVSYSFTQINRLNVVIENDISAASCRVRVLGVDGYSLPSPQTCIVRWIAITQPN